MTGTKRINKATNKLVAAVKELERGIEEVRGQMANNQTIITTLADRNQWLNSTCAIAQNLSDGLSELIEKKYFRD